MTKDREIPINQVLQGNCIKLMRNFPKESIDCLITSPPYWELQAYGEGAVVEYYQSELGKYCYHEWEIIVKPKERGSTAESTWSRQGRDWHNITFPKNLMFLAFYNND